MNSTAVRTIYVEPEANGKWAVHSSELAECFGHFTDREDAIAAGRSLALDKGFTLVVKRSSDDVDYTENYNAADSHT